MRAGDVRDVRHGAAWVRQRAAEVRGHRRGRVRARRGARVRRVLGGAMGARPFYAQRISSNIVMHGARNALDRIKRLRHDMVRAAAGAA